MDLLDYCSVVWNSCSQTLSNSIKRVQNYVMKLTLNQNTPNKKRTSQTIPKLVYSKRKKRQIYCNTGPLLYFRCICSLKLIFPQSSKQTETLWIIQGEEVDMEGRLNLKQPYHIEIHLNFKVQCSSTLYQQTKQDRLPLRGFKMALQTLRHL